MKFIINNKPYFWGFLGGAILGYLYYSYSGCASGTCLITSKPLNSTMYGGLLGALTVLNFKAK